MAGQLPPEIRTSVKELRFFVEYLWLEHFKDRMCPIPVRPIPLFCQILCSSHKKGPQDATRRQQYRIIIYVFFLPFPGCTKKRLPTPTYLVGCCTISYGTSCLFMKDLRGRKAGGGIRCKSSCNGAIEAFNNPFGDKIATGSFDRMARLCRGGMGLNWRPFVVGLSVFLEGNGKWRWCWCWPRCVSCLVAFVPRMILGLRVQFQHVCVLSINCFLWLKARPFFT